MFQNGKIRAASALAAAVIVLNVGAAGIGHAEHYKVFLLGGQSNMAGRASTSGLSEDLQGPQSDVLYFSGTLGPLETVHPDGVNGGEFGPEVVFGRTMADAFPSTQFALIKYAAGGTALYNDWAPDTGSGPGARYASFQTTVTNGLAALHAAGHSTEIVAMLWHQGESDAVEGESANYETNLTNFIADIRSKYGENLPFLIGEIRRGSAVTIAVADAQSRVGAADPFATFVPAADLTFRDTYHFDAAGMITLSERFADSYVTNYAGPTTDPDYMSWSSEQGWVVGDPRTSDSEDYDLDGLSNDYERRFGLDPMSPASRNPISTPFDPATGTLSYTRRTQSMTNLDYPVWCSTDLEKWFIDSNANQVAGPPSDNIETVAVTIDPDLLSETKLFIKIAAEANASPPAP